VEAVTVPRVRAAIVEAVTVPRVRAAIVEAVTVPRVRAAIVEIMTVLRVRAAIAEIMTVPRVRAAIAGIPPRVRAATAGIPPRVRAAIAGIPPRELTVPVLPAEILAAPEWQNPAVRTKRALKSHRDVTIRRAVTICAGPAQRSRTRTLQSRQDRRGEKQKNRRSR